MFDRLKRLYEEGRIDKKGLINAVDNGLITKEQYADITGESYEVTTHTRPGENQDA